MKQQAKLLAIAVLCAMMVGLSSAIVLSPPTASRPWLGAAWARPGWVCVGVVDYLGDKYCKLIDGPRERYWQPPCAGCLVDLNQAACVSCGCCADAEEPRPQPPDQVEPGQSREGVFDPQTSDIRVDFPAGAVTEPVELRAFRIQELPADVPPPASGMVGSPFSLGAWIRGEGKTIPEFHRSIVITTPYEEGDLARTPGKGLLGQSEEAREHRRQGVPVPQTPEAAPHDQLTPNEEPSQSHASDVAPSDEERLRLSMYDPAALSWIKLCSRVDTYANRISAALLVPTPLEEGGNALLAITLDDTPVLEQVVDRQGSTTLSIPGSNFRLGVLAGTVEVDTYFEVTRLPEVPESDSFKLLPAPVDIKACQADYTRSNKLCQITQFPKPMTIAFDVDADTLSRAGGRANLTILGMQDRQWVDLEEFGFQVVRGDTGISVDTGELGTFGAAVR